MTKTILQKSANGAKILAVAEQFTMSGRIADIRAYGSGNVHDTFLVTREGGVEKPFIFQRLNTHVFAQPELVMRNTRTVTDHIPDRLHRTFLDGGRRWEEPRVLLTEDVKDHWIDPGGSCWRGYSVVSMAPSLLTR